MLNWLLIILLYSWFFRWTTMINWTNIEQSKLTDNTKKVTIYHIIDSSALPYYIFLFIIPDTCNWQYTLMRGNRACVIYNRNRKLYKEINANAWINVSPKEFKGSYPALISRSPQNKSIKWLVHSLKLCTFIPVTYLSKKLMRDCSFVWQI